MNRVAVIGTGPAGLVSLKTALEHGFHVKAFERENAIGGLWRYKESANPSTGYYDEIHEDGFSYPVYASLKANTSNFNTCFSDMLPNNVHGHLRHYEILDYLCNYSQKFNLENNIQFNSKVQRLDKDKTKWVVTYEHNDRVRQEVFDKIMIASGGFRYPKSPIFANESQFHGLCIHGSQVRDEKALFQNKRVLFIGGGYSGSELAFLALKSGAKHVSLIPTSKYPNSKVWLWDRITPNLCDPDNDKKPLIEWDYQSTYENSVASNQYPDLLKTWLRTIDGERTEEIPDLGLNSSGITESNDFFQEQIAQKKLTIYKSPVNSFSQEGVVLKNGGTIDPLDIIVKTTGYKFRFPFLDHIYSPERQAESAMYHNMIPTDRKLDGISFVLIQRGLIVIPTGEMHARWLCTHFLPKRYVSKEGALFSDFERQQMQKQLEWRRKQLAKGSSISYVKYPAKYMDTLAKEARCMPPNHDKLLLSNDTKKVEMGVALYHGPFVGARYRIKANEVSSKAWKQLIDFARTVLGESFDRLVKSYKNVDNNNKSVAEAAENRKRMQV